MLNEVQVIFVVPEESGGERMREKPSCLSGSEAGRLPRGSEGGRGVSVLKEHLFPPGWKVTDNALVHYQEAKAIHQGGVCTADCMEVVSCCCRLRRCCSWKQGTLTGVKRTGIYTAAGS